MLLCVCLLHVFLFCWPLVSDVAFYSPGYHDQLDGVQQTKPNILGRKSVVVTQLCPRIFLMNDDLEICQERMRYFAVVYETIR